MVFDDIGKHIALLYNTITDPVTLINDKDKNAKVEQYMV